MSELTKQVIKLEEECFEYIEKHSKSHIGDDDVKREINVYFSYIRNLDSLGSRYICPGYTKIRMYYNKLK